MNRILKNFFALALIIGNIKADVPVFGKTFFQQRSQGSNLARWLAGQAHHIHLCDTDCVNGSFSITPNYFQSFNEKELGTWFFFNGTNTMRFSGLSPAGAPTGDVFPRNFFLNDNFDGTVSANPLARNFVVDINFFLGLDEWVRGLYFRIDVPVNWTSWDMRLTETTTTQGTSIAANKLGNDMMQPSPRTTIIEAWKGRTLDITNFPDLKQEMRFARIDGKQTKASVADISFLLGYDFLCNDCSHFGIYGMIIAPTGTRPDGEFVFEPIVGNGRHVEAGGGASGHFELWNNGCDQSFMVYFQGFALHMFRAKQVRTFDLKNNGIGSRYLLIKRFNPSDMTYAGEVLFGPNVLSRRCRVRNDIHGEGAFMFDYQNGGFTFDVGYNIWGRTRDRVSITESIPANTFGVQGNTDARLMNGVPVGTSNTTQSRSTIAGTFTPGDQDGMNGDMVFIRTDDLNIESASHPGAISHAIFTHLAYTWENCDYLPYVGIGGLVEFSGRGNRALDQWSVWIKGGFTFF